MAVFSNGLPGRLCGFGVLLVAACSLLYAVPPEITGGDFLSDTTGTNLQAVRTWETSGPFDVSIFDPDAGQLTVDIRVGGPLGGLKGGGVGQPVPSGAILDYFLRFLSGITPGATWVEITASDGANTVTRYINFEITSHLNPPQGEIFEIGRDDEDYHFLVMITDPTPDRDVPQPGQAFFYVGRYRRVNGRVNYGTSSFAVFRTPENGDCPVKGPN